MQNMLDYVPELKKMAGDLSKHVNITCLIKKLVIQKQLLEISPLEQDIAIKDSQAQQFKEVEMLCKEHRTSNMERLRLVSLFALRYEKSTEQIKKLKKLL